jgi:hypothetical protein
VIEAYLGSAEHAFEDLRRAPAVEFGFGPA